MNEQRMHILHTSMRIEKKIFNSHLIHFYYSFEWNEKSKSAAVPQLELKNRKFLQKIVFWIEFTVTCSSSIVVPGWIKPSDCVRRQRSPIEDLWTATNYCNNGMLFNFLFPTFSISAFSLLFFSYSLLFSSN